MVVNYAINEYIENSDHGFSSIAALTGARNGPADVTVIAESCYNGIVQDWTDAGIRVPGKPANFGLYRMYCANGAGNNVCLPRHKDHGVNIVFAIGLLALVYILGVPNQNTRAVDAVSGGTPAAHIGLRPGDVIVAVDGEKTTTFQQIRKRIQASKMVGSSFGLRVGPP